MTLFQKADLTVGLFKDKLDEILGIYFSGSGKNQFLCLVHQITNANYLGPGLPGGYLYGIEHIEYPFLPAVFLGHASQFRIIVVLVADDEMTEIEHRDIQEPFFHQIKDIENTTGSAIAIGERMDRLELIMENGKFHQGIKAILGMSEPLKIGQQVTDYTLTFRRCVHYFPKAVRDFCARYFPYSEVCQFNDSNQIDKKIG